MDNIAILENTDAIAYVNDKPWHGKGTKVPGLMTVVQALIAGKCDYEVEKRPIVDAIDGVEIPNTFAMGRVSPETSRFEPFEGSVKGRYTIVQNREAFDFFNQAIEEGVACIETVGALGNGETAWMMAKLPDTFEVVKGDPIEKYILLTVNHDGTASIMGCMTPWRVVCQNTLTAALYDATNLVKIRHTKNYKKKLEQLDKLLGVSAAHWEAIRDAFKQLTMRDMKQLEVIEFIEHMFPGKREKIMQGGKEVTVDVPSTRTENNRELVRGLFNGNAIGADLAGHTYYGMYNAITEYIDRHRTIHNLSPNELERPAQYWQSSNFGSGVDMRQKAFNALFSMSRGKWQAPDIVRV